MATTILFGYIINIKLSVFYDIENIFLADFGISTGASIWWQVEKLSTWLLSWGQEFDEKFLDSNHVLKVYFKPSRKNKDFVFLPVPILPGWLKILHLILGILYVVASFKK